jgi:hypothetical protein
LLENSLKKNDLLLKIPTMLWRWSGHSCGEARGRNPSIFGSTKNRGKGLTGKCVFVEENFIYH